MIRLLSTDLDGTIWDHDHPHPIAPQLFERIRLFQKNGSLWVLNTGRHLQILPSLLRQLDPDLAPDFIVSEERYIHFQKNSDYLDHTKWNVRSTEAQREILERHGPELRALYDDFRKHFVLEPVPHQDLLPYFVARTVEEADTLQINLESKIVHLPDVILVRNACSFRFSHVGFSKGTALSEIARMCNVKKKDIFAAGDNYNDLSMLDGLHAGMVAAPSNAIPLIKDAVRRSKGYISKQRCGLGVLEALEHFSKSHAERTLD